MFLWTTSPTTSQWYYLGSIYALLALGYTHGLWIINWLTLPMETSIWWVLLPHCVINEAWNEFERFLVPIYACLWDLVVIGVLAYCLPVDCHVFLPHQANTWCPHSSLSYTHTLFRSRYVHLPKRLQLRPLSSWITLNNVQLLSW